MTSSITKFWKSSVTAVLATFLLIGCSGPVWQFPGGALQGPEQPFLLSSISPEGGIIQLETDPDNPYSVNVGYVVIGNNMYIDPTESRTWYQNIADDPRIRIRFDGADAVHPAIAVEETEATVLQQFESDRHVFKLLPRKR